MLILSNDTQYNYIQFSVSFTTSTPLPTSTNQGKKQLELSHV